MCYSSTDVKRLPRSWKVSIVTQLRRGVQRVVSNRVTPARLFRLRHSLKNLVVVLLCQMSHRLVAASLVTSFAPARGVTGKMQVIR